MKHSVLEHSEYGSHARPRPRELWGPRRVSAPGDRAVHTWRVRRPSRRSRRHSRPRGSTTRREGASQKGHKPHECGGLADQTLQPENEQVCRGARCGLAETPGSNLHTRPGHLDSSPGSHGLVTGHRQGLVGGTRCGLGHERGSLFPVRRRPCGLHIWCAHPFRSVEAPNSSS